MPDPPPARSTFAVAALPEGRPGRDRGDRPPRVSRRAAARSRVDTPGGSPIPSGDRSDDTPLPARRAPRAARATTAPLAPDAAHEPSKSLARCLAPRRPDHAAVVLAAGLGTRMKSRVPKVLHPLCGRPMLAYVLDAWAEAAAADGTRRAAGRRLLAGRRGDLRASSPTAADVRAPGRAARHRRRRPGRRSRPCPTTRPRSSSCPATCPLVTAADLEAILEARRAGRRGDRAGHRVRRPTRPSSAASSAASSGSWSGSSRPRTRPRTSSPATRSTPACTRSTPPGCGAGSTTLEPSPTTGELYLTELVRLAREDGRLVSAVAVEDDGRFDGINDRSQLARAEWNLRVAPQRAAHARRRDDARPVHGLPRLGRRARPGRHPRAERHPARRDRGRGGERHRRRAARSSTATIGARAASGRASSSRSTVEDEARSGRSATCGRAASSARAPRSATSPSSRTAASARARSSTT